MVIEAFERDLVFRFMMMAIVNGSNPGAVDSSQGVVS
jgi:hypothetical protein